ncbi:cupin domain-containing protein [Halobiforma nitratireducens]|uniref:Cupin 2 conserved barrel domain protein n=1 Tax=Halobiforma nitratireducens JCM 10879 TaxID=1227454 RepID=M0M700_9EURY|nr:cupin domain-containing protein [Halobiforma nitratireducens]EMA41173.1 Cupin 2 conserved barrel domain protein [Halobiforma nitratireducens JCM 10879]
MPERTSLESLTETPHAVAFENDPRTVRLELEAEQRVPEHRHPESTVLFHVLSGDVALDLDGETYDLESGDLVRFDGDRTVSPYALEESTALVVLTPKPEPSTCD